MATEDVTVTIQHHFSADGGQQAITVTMLTAPDRKRLERKVVKAQGEGEVAVTFTVPGERSAKAVRFAAFVGEDFKSTPQHIESTARSVK